MEKMMRKPRDFDSELKALHDKAQLKARKVQQLGELVIATGADTVDPETLAGALLVIADTTDAARNETGERVALHSFRSKRARRRNSSNSGRSRLTVARRVEASKRRTDMREWHATPRTHAASDRTWAASS